MKRPSKRYKGKSKRKPHSSFVPHPKESQEIVLAIRRGLIDALVMSGTDGEEVLTLHGAEHPYRVLVETINDGVATLDEAGTILYANSRIAAILRARDGQFIGTPFETHVPEVERQRLSQLIAEGLVNSARGEIVLSASDGPPRVVRLALSPVRNSSPKTVCVVASELTELAEANEALHSNERSLRQLSARLLTLQDEERRHIARDLHDITGQKLAAQSIALSRALELKNIASDPEASRILNECAALTVQISQEVRTLSYLLHPPLLDELGLASAVRWYADGFQSRTAIRLDVEIPPDFARLHPDVEVALFRVIQESLTNVHRYSGTSKARVRLSATPSHIEVEVADFGKGISRSTLSSSTEKVAPLGVGIQGMKERIRQLGGKLNITSRPNKGTKVTATLPIACVSAAVSGAHFTRRAGAPMQVLLVDDHEMLRRGIRTLLEQDTGLEICGESINGKDAIDKVSALHPDLVILDINLPGVNGLEAIGQIRRHSPESKVLVFSVHDSEQSIKEARAAGAHAFLSKVRGGDELLRTVRNLLGLVGAASGASAASGSSSSGSSSSGSSASSGSSRSSQSPGSAAAASSASD